MAVLSVFNSRQHSDVSTKLLNFNLSTLKSNNRKCSQKERKGAVKQCFVVSEKNEGEVTKLREFVMVEGEEELVRWFKL